MCVACYLDDLERTLDNLEDDSEYDLNPEQRERLKNASERVQDLIKYVEVNSG